MSVLLAIDIGNTRWKAGWFEDGRLIQSRPVLATASDEALRDWLQSTHADEAIVSSVVPASLDRALKLLASSSIRVARTFQSDGGVFDSGLLTSELETPATTGVDRLLGALAAHSLAAGQSAIVVDAGSAITVNLVSADRTFQGGAILPGLRLMAKALNDGTAALPPVRIERQPVVPGRSTHGAIEAGIFFAAVGAIERLVAAMIATQSAAERDGTAVFVTGGDAGILSPSLSFPHRVEPNLVLHGLAAAWRHLQSAEIDRA